MKKNCFKITAAVLSVLMLLPMLAACGAVEDIGDSISGIFDKATPAKNFTMTEMEDGEGYFITDYNDKEKDVVIPEEYKGEKIVSIGPNAFRGSDMTSITIPDTVTSIANSAFDGCNDLVSVTIGDNVKSIDEKTFSSCPRLETITIGNGVKSIGDLAFYNCKSLTSVTIPDSVTSIGSHAFSDCTKLTGIVIPDSVTNLGSSAFNECTGLTSVTIGDGVTKIDIWAFRGCTGLTSVTIGSGVTYIEMYAFSDCHALQSVTFEDTSGWFFANYYEQTIDVTNAEDNAVTIKEYSDGKWYKK